MATPEDPASAAMDENIYRFALREIPGAFWRLWRIEVERFGRKGVSVWSFHNEMLQNYVITLVLQLGLVLVFGWIMLPFLLLHNGFSWWVLTSANYIEHYGLLRDQQADTNARVVAMFTMSLKVMITRVMRPGSCLTRSLKILCVPTARCVAKKILFAKTLELATGTSAFCTHGYSCLSA